jgi:hypothetical protein
VFSLQKSLGDIIGDEAEVSSQMKDKPNKELKKKSFLKKRNN